MGDPEAGSGRQLKLDKFKKPAAMPRDGYLHEC
jgi:hypothetical protein